MVAKETVGLLVGLGVEGDRYARAAGSFSSALPQKVREVSLITRAGIDAANRQLEAAGFEPYADSETRRNIVLEGLTSETLNSLVGQLFYLGSVKLLATELCIPCERPAKLTSKKHFLKAFENRGGIRASVVESGNVRVGDLFTCAHESSRFNSKVR